MSWFLRFAFFLLLAPSVLLGAVVKFSDEDFLKLQQQSRDRSRSVFLVYTWSPHMNLSVRGLEELMESGQNNLILVPVLDPNANLEIATEIAKQKRWPAEVLRVNEARALIQRGSRVHYPSYSFLRKGQFQGPLLPGYKTGRQLETFRKKHLP
jgi:hypothetical protein